MLRSMTGFGRAGLEDNGRTVVVEVKSVNHRYLDIGMRLPRSLSFLESPIRSVLAEKLSRGHIDVYVNYKNQRVDSKAVEMDLPLLHAYRDAITLAGKELGMPDEPSIIDIVRFPEVFSVVDSEDDNEIVTQLCVKALNIAVEGLIGMRSAEGAALRRDLKNKSDSLIRHIEVIAGQSEGISKEYRDKLKKRIEELLSPDVKLDEGRLENEIAYLSDHANIDEEIVRFKSHVDQFNDMLDLQEPAGRKLDFLVQELNREANTIASKSSDSNITRKIIDIKAEIEKIREQVQNIE